MEWLSKRIPTAMNRCATMEVLLKEWVCFYMICAEMLQGRGKVKAWSVVGWWPARNGMSAEAEESPLIKSVTRKHLVKTEKTMCAIVTVIFGVCNSVRLL
jgi:hypothetical protein